MIDRARVLGKKCYLRPLEREDLTDEYLSWVNDISTNGYIHATGFPINRELLEEYFEAAKPPGVVMFAVCDIETHKHIGNARLSYIDWVHRTARYGWLIGASGKRGRGIGSEALVLLLRFGFHHLGTLPLVRKR